MSFIAKIEAKRVISGTFGELWLDGDYVAEITGTQAKVNFKKEPIQSCGDMWERQKIVGMNGTGSFKMNKVFSRMAIKLRPLLENGQTVTFTAISKLHDPDSFGCERLILKEVMFDDVTLADWAAGTPGKLECPFTFAGCQPLDEIAPR
jgi:hypothetical protein